MPRVRDVLTIGLLPAGPLDAITDVAGVRVGHATIRGGRLRTGVTAVLPHGGDPYREKVTAACAVFNGYGKSLGLMQIDELGTIETPILLTSTLNVPRVADALLTYLMQEHDEIGDRQTVNPIVLECFDGHLSDARARAAGEAEVFEAIRGASGGPVAEGCVGAGAGMWCLGYKSGIGTASRVTPSGLTVGVLAIPNFGPAPDLLVAGVPVGRELAAPRDARETPGGGGSCVFVVATDAPLAAVDLRRVAQRTFLGMARTGAVGWHQSGDLAVAFGTSPRQERQEPLELNRLFRAAVEASEEAILGALFAAEDTAGRDGHAAPALPIPETLEILRRHGVPVREPRA